MVRSLMVVVVVCGCAPSRLTERRDQVRQFNAAAVRAPGLPVLELVVDGQSFWPTSVTRPCAPLVARLPDSMRPGGTFELRVPAGAPRPAVHALVSAFGCERGWAAFQLEGVAGWDVEGTLRGTWARTIPELTVVASGLPFQAVAREGDCVLPVLISGGGGRPYAELVTLQLRSDHDQATARSLLRQHACALGADALVLVEETYDLPTFQMLSDQVSVPMVHRTRVRAAAITWSDPNRPQPTRLADEI